MSRWSLGISNLWSPKKQGADAAPPTSPLAEHHPNRIQKSRDRRGKTYTRKGKAQGQRLSEKFASTSVLEELGEDGSSPASRRGSHASRSHSGRDESMVDHEDSAFDSNENQDPEDDDRVQFASQPAHIAHMSLDMDTATQDQEEAGAVTATPDEAAEDRTDEEDPPTPQDDPADAPAADALTVDALTANAPAADEPTAGEPAADEPAADVPTADDEEEMEEDVDDSDDEQYTFTGLLDHRWDGDEMEIQVQWHGSDPTWEPEANLHRDAPDALFRFWEAQGGRPANPRDPGLYDIFAIRGHSRNRQRLLVEWTGYPPSENSWVSRRLVQKTAPEVVDDYMKNIPRKK
ncbi:hypothetical protein ACO1O0_006014 [Amphichorda felina]